MELIELLENTRNYNSFSDTLKANIIEYFEGQRDFESIGLDSAKSGSAWSMMDALKTPWQISENKDIIQRVCRVFFSLVEKNDVDDAVRRVDFKEIIKIYPEFYSEIMPKDKLMYKIFIEEGHWRLQDGIADLIDIFDEEEIKDFLINYPMLKSGGFYKYSRNLLCVYNIAKIRGSYEKKEYDNIKKYVLEYLSILADDYLASDDYIKEGKIRGDKFRKALSSDEKNAFLELINTGENWNSNIKFLKENLFKVRTGSSKRIKYAFIEHDEDFTSLYNAIDSMKIRTESMEFISRFSKLLQEVTSSFYLNKYYSNFRKSCAWGSAQKAVEGFSNYLEKYNHMADKHADYFVVYTIEHYACRPKVHSETMKLLVEKFGVDYVVDHMNVKGDMDLMKGIYLVSKYGMNDKLNEMREERYEKILENFLPIIAKDEAYAEELKDYILCKSDKVDFKKALKTKIEDINEDGQWYFFEGKRLERIVEMVLTAKKPKLTEWMIFSFLREDEQIVHKFLLDEVIKLDINTGAFLKELLSFIDGRYHVDVLSRGVKYLEDNGINCVELAEKFGAKSKKIMLDAIYLDKKTKQEAVYLVNYLGDKQKGVVQGALTALKNLHKSVIAEVEEKIYSELESYKGDKEVYGVEVLCHYASDKERLKKCYNTVKEPKSRDILAEAIGLDLEDLYRDSEGNFDLDLYLDSVYKKQKKFPMELDKLELPVRKDGKDAVKAVEQLIITYKNSDELTINKEALAIAKCFTEESIKSFAKSVFLYWTSSDMEAKTKWQLLIPVIHGGFELIKELEKFIEKLGVNSRQKMAVYLIKAMGLNGSKEAFIAIDRIGRRTRLKTLRIASSEAFEIAAEQLGISNGELGDQLVGDMGFVDGYIPLDYGKQIMKLYIGKSLKFEIENEAGKSYKSLPKGSKDDDEEKIAEAKEKFKQLKKELKDMVTLQTNRLEDALIEWRLWDWSKWKELFLDNPIMNVLGKGLVWGIYEENKLIKSFAFDTEIFDMDYEDVEPKENQKIGIVHPLELSNEETAGWKEVFEENETTILFDQLDREIIEVEDEEALEFVPKDFPRKNPATFINRLRKKGWNIGSVRDGGSFNEVYKELRILNVGIELTLLEHPYVGYYGYEADSDDGFVGVEKIEFYRLGKISRGSYIYDELEKHNGLRYKASELPKRLVSELLFELKRFMS